MGYLNFSAEWPKRAMRKPHIIHAELMYCVRLVKNGERSIEDIPEHYRELVQKKLDEEKESEAVTEDAQNND